MVVYKKNPSELCDYCKEIDDMSHFFFLCINVRAFWKFNSKLARNYKQLTTKK